MSHPLPLTGERTLPGVPGEEYWFARHEAAYFWVASTYAGLLTEAVVVEAGSGEGYGADLLRAAGARALLALEYDEATVAHAARAYPALGTVRANLAHLPVLPGSADLVVSLQVVEHLWELRAFLRDCAAALRPGGVLVVSTPNRPVFSPGLGRRERPTNPFHVEEFDAEQLADLLAAAGLRDVVVHGLHHGPRITAWEAEHGSLVDRQVAAALGGSGDPALGAFVATITAEDFLVGDHDGAQDLIATAVAP
jgi:SAM-dependent methyltransferase